jgi:putative spermidine/putrescine transport system substrate-binding protein
MKKISRRDFLKVAGISAAALGLTACGNSSSAAGGTAPASTAASTAAASSAAASAATDINSMTVEELVAAAAKEGNYFETVGMPDDWSNWGESWATLKSKYGIEHADTDMTSSEELSTFDAEKDDATRDLGDIGMSFAPTAIEMDVVQGFKPSTWDSIPDWAKDPEGRWIISYTGTMTFCALSDTVGGKLPGTWADLKASKYKISVGNVPSGAASQAAVLSCAYAYGGDMDNPQPGIDYFVEMAKAGRLDPGDTTYARMADGEMEVCAAMYEYSSMSWKDNLKSDADLDLLVTIPQDGAVTNGYCLVFNKYSKHPYTTALAIEYLLSDEGQVDRARGYAHPIRDVALPSDIESMDPSLYKNATTISDIEKLNNALSKIAEMWTEQVVPLLS